jgi:hypothetical protein
MYVAILVVIGGIVGTSTVGAQTLTQAPPPAASPAPLIVEEDVAPYRTALGYHVLDADTGTGAGTYNTGLGFYALTNNTTGYNNTATGDFALTTNTEGYDNTASGVSALTYNTTGHYNTANGKMALAHNTTGSSNTASGTQALYSNTEGYYNTASGAGALYSNTTGYQNTASGTQALYSNTEGVYNTASGVGTLYFNTTGYANTASGQTALLLNTTGVYNTGVGFGAGDHALGSHNIFLGAQVSGTANDTNTMRLGLPYDGTNGQNQTFIAGIYGTAVSNYLPVVIDPNGQLGTVNPQSGGGLPTPLAAPSYASRLAELQQQLAALQVRLAELEARVGK